MPVTKRDPYDFRGVLLYGATTDAVPWDLIGKSRTEGWSLPWPERVDLFFRFVNAEAVKVRDWHRFCGARLTLSGPLQPIKAGDAVPGVGPLPWADHPIATVDMLAAWEKQPGVRLPESVIAPLREALNALIDDREHSTVSDLLRAYCREITNGRVLTVTEFSAGREARDWVIAQGMGPALIFTLQSMLDPPCRGLLRRCALESCGRFALGEPRTTKGQPPNFYCSNEDRDEHRRQQQRERAAASRRREPVQKYRKRQIRRGAVGSER